MQRLAARCLALSIWAAPAVAQQDASVQLRVEIIESSLTLTVGSSFLDFGQVSQDATDVIIDPATGERSGMAFGQHSAGQITIVGAPGVSYSVQVNPPPALVADEGRTREPDYDLLWAANADCSPAAFTEVPDDQRWTGTLGELGCAQLQFGGMLRVNGAEPGIYEADLSVYIVRL